MWVFDGEEWTEEGGSDSTGSSRPDTNRQRFDEFVPELQVLEIVPVPRTNPQVPPLPLP